MNDLTATNGPSAVVRDEAWRQELPFWLQYLVAGYPRAKNEAMTFAVFEDQFADVPDEVMATAVRRWVRDNTFWPAVHELRDYVEWAEGEQAFEQEPDDLESKRARHRRRMEQIRDLVRFDDETMLKWEQERGKMPPDEALGTEWHGYGCPPPPPIDKDTLEQVRAAYERARAAQEGVVVNG